MSDVNVCIIKCPSYVSQHGQIVLFTGNMQFAWRLNRMERESPAPPCCQYDPRMRQRLITTVYTSRETLLKKQGKMTWPTFFVLLSENERHKWWQHLFYFTGENAVMWWALEVRWEWRSAADTRSCRTTAAVDSLHPTTGIEWVRGESWWAMGRTWKSWPVNKRLRQLCRQRIFFSCDCHGNGSFHAIILLLAAGLLYYLHAKSKRGTSTREESTEY